MKLSRRDLLTTAAAGGALVAAGVPVPAPGADPPPERRFRPVVTPNGVTLAPRDVGGVKVYHLVAAPVDHTFAPGLEARCWGYNGRTPGPTLEAMEGDRVRIYVTNRLPEPTSIHWHGFIIPSGMDGVGGLNQPYIQPGETFRYEMTLLTAGTYMYHPHVDEMTQMGMGLMGMFIVHPRRPRTVADRDYAIMLGEWHVPVGARRPDPREMTDFNVLTLNGKAFPATEPLVAQRGERVRIRYGNLSAMHNHPMHLHGYHFKVTATDGGPIPEAAQWPETTVLVPVGSTRDIELTADHPGDWALHCHFTHHIMNQMGHGGPNMIGADLSGLGRAMRDVSPGTMLMGDTGMSGMGEMQMPAPANSIPMKGGPGPYGYIDMGGMFTLLKVRDALEEGADAGWYDAPEDTRARQATAAELAEDGVEL